jgi:hypothetical protein
MWCRVVPDGELDVDVVRPPELDRRGADGVPGVRAQTDRLESERPRELELEDARVLLVVRVEEDVAAAADRAGVDDDGRALGPPEGRAARGQHPVDRLEPPSRRRHARDHQRERYWRDPTGLASLDDDFAPAQFFDLSDDEKLSRPAFESLGAGVRVRTAGFARGGSQDSDIAYETVVVDDRTMAPATDSNPYHVSDAKLHALAEHGAAAGSRLTPPPRFVAASAGISLSKAGYVVVGRHDLTRAAFAGAPGTYSRAADVLAAHLAAHPEDEGAYQVVALHEAA